MHGFVEHDRALLAAQRIEALGARAFAPRQESLEHEVIGRQAGRRRAPRCAAHGPGIGTTSMPAACAALTSRQPGSLISGVPASLTSATDCASLELLEEGRHALGFVMLVVRNKSLIPRRFAIAIPGYGAYPRPQ